MSEKLWCVAHPGIPGEALCPACGQAFCSDCLFDTDGRKLCEPCRVAHLVRLGVPVDVPPPPARTSLADHIIPTRNPQALIGYYVSVFSVIPCLGLLLGPVAIVLGSLGMKAIQATPGLPGKGHALTALILGGLTTLANVGVFLWIVISMASRR